MEKREGGRDQQISDNKDGLQRKWRKAGKGTDRDDQKAGTRDGLQRQGRRWKVVGGDRDEQRVDSRDDKGEKQRDTETGNQNVPWAVAQTKREYVFSSVSINFHSAS